MLLHRLGNQVIRTPKARDLASQKRSSLRFNRKTYLVISYTWSIPALNLGHVNSEAQEIRSSSGEVSLSDVVCQSL